MYIILKKKPVTYNNNKEIWLFGTSGAEYDSVYQPKALTILRQDIKVPPISTKLDVSIMWSCY